MGFPIHELTAIDNRLCPVRRKIAGAVPEQKRYHFPALRDEQAFGVSEMKLNAARRPIGPAACRRIDPWACAGSCRTPSSRRGLRRIDLNDGCHL
jgi:hypothetical protein